MVLLDARDLHQTATTRAYAAKQAVALARVGRAPFDSSRKLVAYVNSSRLIVDCPECNNSCAVLETEARCFSCGAVFSGVDANFHAAGLAVLECRPKPHTRNWRRDECVYELVRQNVEAGDDVPQAVIDGL